MYNEEAVEAQIAKVEKSLKETHYHKGDRLKVGVDLGTAYIGIVVLNEKNEPVANELQAAHVLKYWIIVDYVGALNLVKTLKEKLELRLGVKLLKASIAMPPGTESSIKTHRYVIEGAEMEVSEVLDEPTAANNVLKITDGAVVDIGGGTTGLSIFKQDQVVYVADEATGGTHLTLVLAGSHHLAIEEAEAFKKDPAHQKEILGSVKAVIEKMATIVKNHIAGYHIDTIYLCGGTCCLPGMETIFEKTVGIRTVKPSNPLLITPTGIAMSCEAFTPEKTYN
ncbi:MAG: ethanolamine utilization protein EutJ [Niameybacter sp.]